MCQENVPEEKYMELLSKIQAGLQTVSDAVEIIF